MNHPTPTLPPDLPRFDGAQSLAGRAAFAGGVGLVLTFVGMIFNPRDALLAYLVSFAYWCFLALGALAFLMAHYTAGARWHVVIRRITEAIAATAPVFLVLFLPLLLGAKNVWIWVSPSDSLGKEFVDELHHKRPYLNYGFFALRALLYFAIWSALAWVLRQWSLAQDEDGSARWTVKARKLSAPGLLVLALSLSFAAFDWIMSLQPLWYSTIFGLYIFAGGFVATLSLMAIVIARLRSGPNPLGRIIGVDHQHNVGKLMLAFVAFWAYMGFSQYMLIWAGDLPEEVPWITIRSHGPWRPVGILLILGQFVLPFLLLLSRDLKRSVRALTALAAWLLFIHFVDVYWVVMPALHPHDLGFHWTHVTSFVGIGGLAIAAGLWSLRGAYPVPVRDPYLEDSLRYHQP